MSDPVVLETHFADLRSRAEARCATSTTLARTLLIVATDRISAFDYVLGSGIPDKGKVLTQLSAFWFGQMGDLVPHHLLSIDVDDFPASTRPYRDVLRGRSMLVRKTEPVPIECVARGYLSGSGWKDYQRTGAVCGVALAGRACASPTACPRTIFTPATKAESGHDENISEARAAEFVGARSGPRMRDLTLAIYERGVALRRRRAASSSRTPSSSSGWRATRGSC